MHTIYTIGWFILVLGVVIFVHEFGHFATAKAFGMRVFIFSFGFGKRLMGFKWGDTDYRLSLIPLGGYVKLEGEGDDVLSEDVAKLGDGKDFTARPRWQRFLVYLAGPVMNAVLTIGVITVFHMVGFAENASKYDLPLVGVVDPDSPASRAGLQTADRILEIDGQAPANWEDLHYILALRSGREVRLRVLHEGQEREVTLQSAAIPGEKIERFGETIGISPPVRIGAVKPDTPAGEAGLREGDAILFIDDKPIRTFMDIVPIVDAAAGRALRLRVFRDGTLLDVQATPRNMGDGPRLGIPPKMVIKHYPFGRSVQEATKWTWEGTVKTLDVLRRLLTGQISPKNLMGPIGIARASGEAGERGYGDIAFLIAMISLQVGILNLFPLAPLDGGHLAILAGEGVIRRDLSLDAKAWIMNAGAIVLLCLIVVVLYSDLSKIGVLSKYLP
jgi:regulator of sigma E protease